jgi:hypothetical protein
MHGPNVAKKEVTTHHWQQIDDGLRGLFGALRNLGKPYFLQHAANVVRDVNAQRDKNEILYARKAMVWCRM